MFAYRLDPKCAYRPLGGKTPRGEMLERLLEASEEVEENQGTSGPQEG
jgi:hypothetical protein